MEGCIIGQHDGRLCKYQFSNWHFHKTMFFPRSASSNKKETYVFPLRWRKIMCAKVTNYQLLLSLFSVLSSPYKQWTKAPFHLLASALRVSHLIYITTHIM